MSDGTGHHKHAFAQGKVAKPVTADPTTEALITDIRKGLSLLSRLTLNGEPATCAYQSFDALAARLGEEQHRTEQAELKAAGMAASAERAEARLREVEERVAEALYERAMSERRTFSREPAGFAGRWRDEPYVPPLQEGESRPTNWRDGWRDDARAALAASPGGGEDE